MAVISWGKCTIKYKGSTDQSYTAFPIPVDGSTSVETTEGEKLEAKEEGGGVVDVIYKKPESALVFDLYMKNPGTGTFSIPLNPSDGVVAGEYAIQLIPEDDDCPGIQIDKARITTTIQYSSSEGLRIRYRCTALTPDSGDMMKVQVIS